MSFERKISDDEIAAAREKGVQRAQSTFDAAANQNNPDQFLNQAFLRAVDALNHMVENFYRHEFSCPERMNHQASDAVLKGLLLQAFDLGEYIKLLEQDRDRRNGIEGHVGVARCYKASLKAAVKMYKTNGGFPVPVNSDVPPETLDAA